MQKGQQDERAQHSKLNMSKMTHPGRKAGNLYMVPLVVKGVGGEEGEMGSAPMKSREKI